MAVSGSSCKAWRLRSDKLGEVQRRPRQTEGNTGAQRGLAAAVPGIRGGERSLRVVTDDGMGGGEIGKAWWQGSNAMADASCAKRRVAVQRRQRATAGGAVAMVVEAFHFCCMFRAAPLLAAFEMQFRRFSSISGRAQDSSNTSGWRPHWRIAVTGTMAMPGFVARALQDIALLLHAILNISHRNGPTVPEGPNAGRGSTE